VKYVAGPQGASVGDGAGGFEGTQNLPQPREEAGEALADGSEDGTVGIAARACEVVVVHPVASSCYQ
jgi:hypothetical protein